jgi:hypothetical protein
MNWILDNLQIVVIIVLALGSWLSSRMEAKKTEVEEPDDEEVFEPARRPEPSVPPPLARNAPLELPAFAEERANEAAAILKHQQDLEARLRQIRETKATTSGGASATRSRLAAKGRGLKPAAPAMPSLRVSIRNRGELRRDIVMREVLGTPVGLR